MKGRKISCGLLAISMMFMTGCGEPMLEMTDEERSIIVNYAAHVVSKYNNYQGEGMTYVSKEEKERLANENKEQENEQQPEEEEPSVAELPQEEIPGTEPQPQEQPQNTEQPSEEVASVTLQQALGFGEAIQATYNGYDVMPNYVEGDYYALDADAGKTFLIMHIDLTNQTAEAMNCNLLAAGPVFTLTVNDGYKVNAETTILLDDLGTFSADLQVGETASTVLLFQISEEQVAKIEKIGLQVYINNEKFDINLPS